MGKKTQLSSLLYLSAVLFPNSTGLQKTAPGRANRRRQENVQPEQMSISYNESVPLPLAQIPARSPWQAFVAQAARTQAAARHRTSRLLALWHLTSFDAPTVAIVWSLAFAWAAGIPLPGWAPLLLALMAWSAYVGDRLLDARAGLRDAERHPLHERHLFHWRHRRILIPLAAGALLAAARIIFVQMPHTSLTPNSLLGAAAFAYFSGVHSHRKLPRLATKEVLVGVIFTAACMLPVWLRMGTAARHPEHGGALLVLGIFFAALAWFNCFAIAQWESTDARMLQRISVARSACLLALAGALLAGSLFAYRPRAAALLMAAALSALLLALLDRNRHRLAPLALRAAADFVLLTPILLLPFAHLRG